MPFAGTRAMDGDAIVRTGGVARGDDVDRPAGGGETFGQINQQLGRSGLRGPVNPVDENNPRQRGAHGFDWAPRRSSRALAAHINSYHAISRQKT